MRKQFFVWNSQTKHLVLSSAFALAGFATFPFAANAATESVIRVDGSSTVFPISEAVAEEFSISSPKIRVNVGVSGTGGGFKKFALKEIDIVNASRTIKDSESDAAKKNGIDFIEIPVALDGITVVTNPKNTWAKDLTFAELQKIWAPQSKIKTWSDIRADWPKTAIKFFGPGTDSGTFDYFSEVVGGKTGALRSDYVKSEDDNVLVRAVSGETNAMGFFGYAYYIENQKQLKALSINGVEPNTKNIQSLNYKPLSREVYIYVNKNSLKQPHVKAFVEFYIKNTASLSKEVGYVPLDAKVYKKALDKLP